MMECTHYIEINRGSCLGMATVYVKDWKAEVSGLFLFQKDGKRWVNLPCREVKKEGEKTKYYKQISFPCKEDETKFTEMVKTAIDVHAKATSVLNPVEEVEEKEELPF